MKDFDFNIQDPAAKVNFQILRDDFLRKEHNPIYYEDLRVPFSTVRLPAANPPTATSYKNSEILAFSTTADNYVYFTCQLPHSYEEGSDIYPHLHWTIPTDGAGSGEENVKWDFTYSWANFDDTFPSSVSDTITIDVQKRTADAHMKSKFATINGSDKKISSVLMCSLKRDVSVSNDYTDNAYGVEFDFHYKKNTIGSLQELRK